MVSLVDIKWLARCQAQLRDMAMDPGYAARIVEVLDADPELREQLAGIYVRALKTLESARQE